MNKRILVLMLIIISICTISHVSANDDLDLIASEDSDILVSDNLNLIASDDFDVIASDDSIQIENDVIGPINAAETHDLKEDELSDENKGYYDLQKAINDTSEGETLSINGTYNCDLFITINKTITIDGGEDGTTIRYNGTNESSFLFYITSDASNTVLKNIKFAGADFPFGGAVQWDGANGRIINCEFIDNKVTGEYAIGGAIVVNADNFTVENSNFTNNLAHQHGGAIILNSTDSSIINCSFNGNEALGDEGRGGAIVILANNCNISDCIFYDNKAKQLGGAIYLDGNNTNISNCKFKNNEINGNNLCYGGALFITANNVIVKDSDFTNNHCPELGGAIYIDREYQNHSILNCNFTGNYVSSNVTDNQGGGAIASQSEFLIIDNSCFEKNIAKNGGAIFLFNNAATIKNSYFNGNDAELGHDIVGAPVNITKNYFVIDFDESKEDAVHGVSVDELIRQNNTFYKIKKPSSVDFKVGMVFTYGDTGSIRVNVIGGIIEKKNMVIKNNKNAIINFKNDVITVSNLPVGTYTLYITTTPDENHTAVTGSLKVTVKKAYASVSSEKISVQLKKASYWSCTITDSRTHKPIAGMKVVLKVYTGKKFKKITKTTNSKGIVKYKTSALAKGKHAVKVTATHAGYNTVSFKSSITVVKPTKLTFKVAHLTLKDRSSIMFRVFNKKTKKGLNKVVMNLNIYNGKKLVKIVTLKTMTKSKKKGIIGFSTNELTAGKHKVVLVPANIKYSGKITSTLKLTKSQVKHHPITVMDTAKKYPIKVIK